MTTLEEAIRALSEEIQEYRVQLRAATNLEEKKMYADLITERGKTLNILLQQQQSQAQGGGGDQEQVKESVNALISSVNELKMSRYSHHGVTTEAEFVKCLRQNGELQPETELFCEVVRESSFHRWIAPGPLVMHYPDVGVGENDKKGLNGVDIIPGTQSYVSQMLDEIKASTFLYPERAPTRVCRDNRHFNKSSPVKMDLKCHVDSTAYRRPSFGNRKPDVVCFASKETRGSQDIVLLGDVKGRAVGNFTDAEIGHVLDFGTDLMANHQVARRKLYVFLTDGYRFQFFSISPGNEEGRWSIFYSSVYVEVAGWQILVGLLQLDPSTLGHTALQFSNISIGRVLGRGRFCTAFESTLASVASSGSVVAKVFHSCYDSVMKCEKGVLITLAQHNVGNVPRYEADEKSSCGEFNVLVVSPLGEVVLPIRGGSRTVGEHWATLVMTLQRTHGLGIAHRDVKPGNIFVTEDRIILNDWGSSCKINERTRWVGTRGYSEEADEDGCHTPTAVGDLKALLRSVYSMMTQETPPYAKDNQAISKFWEERWRASTFWHTCLVQVNAGDYGGLATIFGQLK